MLRKEKKLENQKLTSIFNFQFLIENEMDEWPTNQSTEYVLDFSKFLFFPPLHGRYLQTSALNSMIKLPAVNQDLF